MSDIGLGPRWGWVWGALLVALLAPAAAAQEHGALSSDHFLSDALGVRKRYVIYLPPSYVREPSRRLVLPVLVKSN